MAQSARASVATPETKRRVAPAPKLRTAEPVHVNREYAGWSGNQARLRLLPLQRKLAIGSVSDPLEAEADRVAEQVTRAPGPGITGAAAGSNASPGVVRRCSCGGTCDTCQNTASLRRKQAGSNVMTEAPPSVHETLRSSGRPLEPATRAYMEPRFGTDFGAVRVHTDAKAGESARQVDSLAYTVGNSIVFRTGSYQPESGAGRRLLAHELAHVTQQGGGTPMVRRAPATATAEGPNDASLIEKGWTAVNDLGIVYPKKDNPEKPASLFDAPGGHLVASLAVQTKVFLISEDPVGGWYAATAKAGATAFGYVAKNDIWLGLPDPDAEIHRIKKNETPLGLAADHYKGKGFDVAGRDKRYLVNALVWVNTHDKSKKGSRPSIYKTEFDIQGTKILEAGDDRSPWENAQLEAGLLIWLPGAAYMNAVYDQVVKAAGSTGSIHVDLWNTVKKVGHYLAYGLAFAGGLVHGFLASLYDAVSGLASLVWKVVKSVVTGSVISDVEELSDKVGGLKWDDVKDAIGTWAAGWADKLDSDSGWVAGHAHGYLTGYVMAEAAMLLLTGGVLAEIKGAIWGSKLGIAIKETAAFQKLASGIEKIGETGEKVSELTSKMNSALQKSDAGRAVLAAGRVVEWTAKGIAKALALPGEIAQYLTDAAIQGLKRLFLLKPELMERIERFSATIKRWLFGCHSPCEVDLEAIARKLEMTDAQIEKQAAADLEAANAAKQAHASGSSGGGGGAPPEHVPPSGGSAEPEIDMRGDVMPDRSIRVREIPAPPVPEATKTHVFNGDEFGGYHSKARGPQPHVTELKIKAKPDKNGVYQIKVRITKPDGSSVDKYSTMFPDNWTEPRVLQEVDAVMAGKSAKIGTIFRQGRSPSGVLIEIEYHDGVPFTFYPLYKQ